MKRKTMQPGDSVKKRGSDRRDAEKLDANDKRGPAAEAIAEVAREGTTYGHARQSQRQHRTKLTTRHMPFANQRRNRETQDLNVEPVEDDRHCGEYSKQLC